MSKLLGVLCLLTVAHGWNGYFTTEYPQYDLKEQTVTVVFTLEVPHSIYFLNFMCVVQAPFEIVKPVPLSLSAVLDTSGSLKGRGIAVLKSTTEFLIRKLAEDNGLHDIGVVLYDSTVRELTPLIPVTASNIDFLSVLLHSISARGKTALSSGLNRGIRQQISAAGGKLQSIYLFSDGMPNIGPTAIDDVLFAMDRLLTQAGGYISVSTFGVGDAIDIGLLEAIAERGNGEAYVIHHPEDIPLAFGKALGGLTTVVGTRIEVIFTTAPGCRIKSVTTGGVYRQEQRSVIYNDLYAGEFRDILFEVDLAVGPVGRRRCLETEYYYIDPHTGERLTGGRFSLNIERRRRTSRVKKPAYRVEENRVKYAVANAGISAKSRLLEGDERGALDALRNAKSIAKDSVLQDSSTISALLYDIDALIGDVQSSNETSPMKIGRIGNLVRVLRTQRSVSVESGELKTAEMVETKKQKEIGFEIRDKVLDDVGDEDVPNEDGDSDGAEGDASDAKESNVDGGTDGDEVTESESVVKNETKAEVSVENETKPETSEEKMSTSMVEKEIEADSMVKDETKRDTDEEKMSTSADKKETKADSMVEKEIKGDSMVKNETKRDTDEEKSVSMVENETQDTPEEETQSVSKVENEDQSEDAILSVSKKGDKDNKTSPGDQIRDKEDTKSDQDTITIREKRRTDADMDSRAHSRIFNRRRFRRSRSESRSSFSSAFNRRDTPTQATKATTDASHREQTMSKGAQEDESSAASQGKETKPDEMVTAVSNEDQSVQAEDVKQKSVDQETTAVNVTTAASDHAPQPPPEATPP